MDVGLAIIAFLVVGLPLLAYSFASRLPPPRRRTIKPDALMELAKRHRLSSLDVWRVQQAVAEGVRVDPARLRGATVEYADIVLTQNPWGLAALRRRPVLLRALAVAYALVLVVTVLRAPSMVGAVIGVVVSGGFRLQQKRAARRAKEANAAAHDGVAVDAATDRELFSG